MTTTQIQNVSKKIFDIATIGGALFIGMILLMGIYWFLSYLLLVIFT